MTRLLAPALALLLLWGCAAHTVMSPSDRSAISRELSSSSDERYLRVSFHVTPFFGDASKKLLTAVPPEQVRLLEQPNGAPVNPGPSQKILPAGTRARIVEVEFPTAWTYTERVAYTPRHLPWVFLEVQGEPAEPALVLPLAPGLDSPARFFAELERFVSVRDPEKLMAGWGEAVRSAIKTKTALVDMPAEAVQMALGYPERILVRFEGDVKCEEWVYPDESVRMIANGRLIDPGDAPCGKPTAVPAKP